MKSRTLAVLAALLLAGAAGYAGVTANDLPKAAARAGQYWTTVEKEFRQRAELVPQIVGAIEAVSPGQQDLIGRVKTAQAAVLALPADPAAPGSAARVRAFMKTQDGLSENLGTVLDLLRLYPDKSRSEPVRKVFDALELKESHIVVARTDYVAQAMQHNLLLASPPAQWVSGFFHPGAKPLVASFETWN